MLSQRRHALSSQSGPARRRSTPSAPRSSCGCAKSVQPRERDDQERPMLAGECASSLTSCVVRTARSTRGTLTIQHRIAEHAYGDGDGYVARRRPFEVVWVCDPSASLRTGFATRLEALERERQIKGWSRAKKQALIDADWERLQQLARRGAEASAPVTLARTKLHSDPTSGCSLHASTARRPP